MKKSFLFYIFLLVVNCVSAQEQSFYHSEKQIDTCNCNDSSILIKQGLRYKDIRWERDLQIPAKGRLVEESHYLTTQDAFPDSGFPKNITDSIESHLERSFLLYKKFDTSAVFEDVYKNSYNRVWTPAENGECGQGSIGKTQLNLLKPEYEMWMITMMWRDGSRPKPGTKFILSANNRSVVVIAGFETGPASEEFLGGVTCEVHRWLKTNSFSEIEIIFPVNQNLQPGPVFCGSSN